MTSRHDNFTDQVQKFEAWFLFLIFADENFAHGKRNDQVSGNPAFNTFDRLTVSLPMRLYFVEDNNSFVADFWSSKRYFLCLNQDVDQQLSDIVDGKKLQHSLEPEPGSS